MSPRFSDFGCEDDELFLLALHNQKILIGHFTCACKNHLQNSFYIVFKTLQESLHSLNRYFTSISTGNVCCSSVFITTSVAELKRNRTELLKEKTFFYFSVKDFVNSGKNSTTRIRDLLRTVNLRAIFPVLTSLPSNFHR